MSIFKILFKRSNSNTSTPNLVHGEPAVSGNTNTGDANFFVGTQSGTLNVTSNLAITANASTALNRWNSTIYADASKGNITITLPMCSIGNTGKQINIKKTDSTTNTVTIAPSAGQTINGQASVFLTTQHQSINFESDGVKTSHIFGGNVSSLVTSGGQTYKLEEVATGDKWIDGKVVYRKIIAFNNTQSSHNEHATFNTIDASLNTKTVDVIIKCYGMFKDTSNGEMFFMGSAFANASNQAVSVHIASGGITIEVGSKQDDKNSGYVIIEYTKKVTVKDKSNTIQPNSKDKKPNDNKKDATQKSLPLTLGTLKS